MFSAFLIVVVLIIFIGLIIQCLREIRDVFSSRSSFLNLSVVAAVLFTFSFQLNDIMRPKLSSGLIEFHYDLLSDDFQKDGELVYKHPLLGDFKLKKVDGGSNNHYRIYTPKKIVDWILLYTSYDRDGIHIARTDWVNNIDFRIENNFVESNHEFNESINAGMGRHVFAYTYRGSIWDTLKNPAKIFEGLF